MKEINNTQIDHAKNLHDFLPMYNLIKYSCNYFKTGNLWQYYRDASSKIYYILNHSNLRLK